MRHAGAETARRADKIAIAGDEGRAAHQPGCRGPADQDGKRDNAHEADVVGSRQRGRHPELIEVERRQDDQQRQQRQRDDRVGHPHQRPVGPAAEIARDEPDEGADCRRGERRRDTDHQRNAAAGQEAHEDVAAQFIGPERVQRRRPGEAIEQINRVDVETERRAEQRPGKGRECDRRQQQERQFHR